MQPSPELLATSRLTLLELMRLLGVEQLNPDSFVTVAQAAKILNVHPDTVRRNYAMIVSRLSPGRVGIRIRTLFEEVDRRSRQSNSSLKRNKHND